MVLLPYPLFGADCANTGERSMLLANPQIISPCFCRTAFSNAGTDCASSLMVLIPMEKSFLVVARSTKNISDTGRDHIFC